MLKEKIKEILSENENTPLEKIAEKLEVKFVEVLRNTEKSKKYPVEKLEELLENLQTWEKVLLIVVTPNFVLEIKDKFPKGFKAYGYLNFHDNKSSIGGHLSIDKIKEIFLVEDFLFGRKSCSIKFYDENENEIFAVYVPRDEKKELIPQCLEKFYSL